MKTILILDDDEALVKRNKLHLELAFENDLILFAYTIEKVIEFAKKYRIDVFILDIFGVRDDKMDGVGLAEFLRKNGYPYPVPIIITSNAKSETYIIEVQKRIKYYDYMTKPYEPKQLVRQVVSALDFDSQPNPFLDIYRDNLSYRGRRDEISHILKIKNDKRVEIYRRDKEGNTLKTHNAPIESVKSFVKVSINDKPDFVQVNYTDVVVVNVHWVERYDEKEKCVILRKCRTKIFVAKDFRSQIRRLVPVY